MTENQTIKDKLKAIIAYYNLNVRQFEKSIGVLYNNNNNNNRHLISGDFFVSL